MRSLRKIREKVYEARARDQIAVDTPPAFLSAPWREHKGEVKTA
jgi:hypothetical protein